MTPAEFVEARLPEMRGMAHNVSGSWLLPHDEEDLLQEGALAVFEAACEQGVTPTSWQDYGMFAAHDAIRSYARTQALYVVTDELPTTTTKPEQPVTSCPERYLIFREALTKLGVLPTRWRAAVMWSSQGETNTAIGVALGVTRQTSTKTLRKADARLAQAA